MKEFQERRVLRRIIFSRFAFVFLMVVLGFMVYSTVKIYLRSQEANFVNQMVEKEIEELKAKRGDLSAAIQRLESEGGREEEIRSRFSVQKPGEKAVIIIEKEVKNNLPENGSPSGFFEKVWGFIKNIFSKN